MSVIDTLAVLVREPSVSSRPLTGLAAIIAERAAAAGFTVERFPCPGEGKLNLVCSRGPAGSDGLVLSGHMDVVPVDGQPWTTDPFALTERDGRLHGRGTADMKGFIAATLEVLPRLPRLERELVLAFTCDEEVGCLGSREMVQQLAGRPVPQACLIGEPTGFRIQRMHPGHTAVRITTHGTAAHSSTPDLGDNAIHKAAKVVEALEKLAEEWRGDVRFSELLERPFVVINVATISGGSAINIVPDRCVIDVGFRPLPGMDEHVLVATMAERVRAWGSLELLRVTPAMFTPEGSGLEAVLRPHATAPGTGAVSFATDGGNLARLGMIPLVFGPGSIDVAHRADEFIPRVELERAVGVIEEIVGRCCVLPHA